MVFYASGNFTACVDSNATIFFNGVPAGTYYLPVRGEPATAGPYTTVVSAAVCIAPPPNDPCTGAIPLNVNLTCVPISGTDNGATQSLPAIVCGGFTGNANDDVWYNFVATSPNCTVTMTGDAPFDGVMELFSGDCSALVSLACSDATLGGGVESIAATTLAPGATYYVRLYDYYGGYPTTTTFSICATGDVGTSVHDLSNGNFGVHPNPSNGDITITCHNVGGDETIELFDMTGRIVHSERRAMVAGGSVALSLSGQLAAGTYTLRMSTANGRGEQRVMIK